MGRVSILAGEHMGWPLPNNFLMPQLTTIILAAGRGTRMKSAKPKILHEAGGLPLIAYPVGLAHSFKSNIVLVAPKKHTEIKKALKENFKGKMNYVVQDPPRGTGHAVMVALPKIKGDGDVLVLCGDMPLVNHATIQTLLDEHRQKDAVMSFLTCITNGRQEYGRVLRNLDGTPLRIIEAKDANEEQKKIREMNAGVYVFNTSFLKQAIKELSTNNAQKEYYLTDLVNVAGKLNRPVAVVCIHNEQEVLGVNSQIQLAEVEKNIYQQRCQRAMEQGIKILSPETVFIGPHVKLGQGITLFGPCYLQGKTTLGNNTVIEPGCWITDSKIGKGVHLKAYCYISESRLDENVTCGPFAHLRPGTVLKKGSKIGNFVETKKSTIGEGSKVNHLSYIGDAQVGKKVNIGAGTITCNYDGINKYKTVLENGVFVGSDTQFVAPVRVGKNAYIGAGSTITKNVKAGSLALTRVPQRELPRWKKK